jgi:hypothetical protein
VAKPNRWAIYGGVLLLAAAFIVQPHWVESWRGALAGASMERAKGYFYVAPVVMPGGFVALAALARWRRVEARVIVAMACVPHTILLYEAVPLFLVPRTLREAELLVFLSYVVLALLPHTSSFTNDLDVSARWITLLLYIPATLMVLRRPNEGPVPAWLESAIARWPAWLRGRAPSTPPMAEA